MVEVCTRILEGIMTTFAFDDTTTRSLGMPSLYLNDLWRVLTWLKLGNYGLFRCYPGGEQGRYEGYGDSGASVPSSKLVRTIYSVVLVYSGL